MWVMDDNAFFSFISSIIYLFGLIEKIWTGIFALASSLLQYGEQ